MKKDILGNTKVKEVETDWAQKKGNFYRLQTEGGQWQQDLTS
jgi:hypothetical protein